MSVIRQNKRVAISEILTCKKADSKENLKDKLGVGNSVSLVRKINSN